MSDQDHQLISGVIYAQHLLDEEMAVEEETAEVQREVAEYEQTHVSLSSRAAPLHSILTLFPRVFLAKEMRRRCTMGVKLPAMMLQVLTSLPTKSCATSSLALSRKT